MHPVSAPSLASHETFQRCANSTVLRNAAIFGYLRPSLLHTPPL